MALAPRREASELGHGPAFAFGFVYAVSLRLLNTFALALLDEATLHLSYHSKDREHNMTHLSPGRNVRVKHGNKGLPLLAFVDQVEHV